jgi:D-sedoheptulose 7-phosphate isomerase
MSNQNTLSSLYPFLQRASRDPAQLKSELLESVRMKSQDSREVIHTFFDTQSEKVVAAAEAIADMYQREGRLFTMGNGGSSCDAAHIAVEFLHPVTTGRPALPAVNLAVDQAMMTAVGNDVGFDHIFVRQLIAQGKAGDGVIGVSTSGNSVNILRTFEKAKEMRLTTIGLTGGGGGAMGTSSSLDHCLIVPTESIHRIQECHVLIYHILWDLVHTLLADHRGASATKKDSP